MDNNKNYFKLNIFRQILALRSKLKSKIGKIFSNHAVCYVLIHFNFVRLFLIGTAKLKDFFFLLLLLSQENNHKTDEHI